MVGTTADFRGFGPRPSLPINHLLCENRRTEGRIGEDGLEKSKTRIIIPTPGLSELLVRAGPAGAALVAQIQRSSVFRIAPFDTRAAIELAAMTNSALSAGEKRSGVLAPWTKIKFDRQIVAIAKAENANAVYSDDNSLITFAQASGIKTIRLADLLLPPQQAQPELPLHAAERTQKSNGDAS